MPVTWRAASPARAIAGARQWDDDMSRARAALNWPRQFEIAFDGETARALHDEDLPVDTDFCAMCGHDWCSMRISKEIAEFASGKSADFQPERTSRKSPGVTPAAAELLKQRGSKLDCHSDNVADESEARRVQLQIVESRGAAAVTPVTGSARRTENGRAKNGQSGRRPA